MSEYEKMIDRETAEERRQVRTLQSLAAQMAEQCPWLWRLGDGDGGTVLNAVRDAYKEAGVQ